LAGSCAGAAGAMPFIICIHMAGSKGLPAVGAAAGWSAAGGGIMGKTGIICPVGAIIGIGCGKKGMDGICAGAP